jgi:23S rRNA (guanosine2251-2'-O)-methyltransferase
VARQKFITGFHNVEQALLDAESLIKIIVSKGLSPDMLERLRFLTRSSRIPIQVVPNEKLDKLARGKHQGVVGIPAVVRYYRIEDVIPMIYERGETPLLMALDGVTDVRNIGAIARTAYGTGVHALIVPEKGTAPLGKDADEASAHTLGKVTVCRHQSIHGAISYLQLNGIQVYSSDAQADKLVSDLDLKAPLCLVIGDEEVGVSSSVARKADERVRLPISPGLDSYNVSVAAGMLLYEVVRQRRKAV